MKRWMASLLAIITLLSVTVYAEEEFKLHSGVTFGMSLDTVAELEKAAGFEVNQLEDQVQIKGKIAGINNSQIIYYPDDKGSLFNALYFFNTNNNNNSITNSNYESVQQALETKYGASQFNSINEMKASVPESLFNHEITGEYYATRNYRRGWDATPNEVAKYDQWLIQLIDGNFVYIEHFLRTYYKTGNYSHYILYTYLDAPTLTLWQIQTEQEERSVIDDI